MLAAEKLNEQRAKQINYAEHDITMCSGGVTPDNEIIV